MPIMDGIQACVLIKQYFNDIEEEKQPPYMQSHRVKKSSKLVTSPKCKRIGSGKNLLEQFRIPYLYALTSEME